jgi:hypothetical protein
MFKSETRGAIREFTMVRAPVNAVNREWSSGMLIELLETHKPFNAADTRNRVKAFLDK